MCVSLSLCGVCVYVYVCVWVVCMCVCVYLCVYLGVCICVCMCVCVCDLRRIIWKSAVNAIFQQEHIIFILIG